MIHELRLCERPDTQTLEGNLVNWYKEHAKFLYQSMEQPYDNPPQLPEKFRVEKQSHYLLDQRTIAGLLTKLPAKWQRWEFVVIQWDETDQLNLFELSLLIPGSPYKITLHQQRNNHQHLDFEGLRAPYGRSLLRAACEKMFCDLHTRDRDTVFYCPITEQTYSGHELMQEFVDIAKNGSPLSCEVDQIRQRYDIFHLDNRLFDARFEASIVLATYLLGWIPLRNLTDNPFGKHPNLYEFCKRLFACKPVRRP